METHLIDLILLDTGILQYLFNRLHGLAEKIHVKFLELGASESLGEVIATVKGFNFELGGLLAGESPLGLLDFPFKFTHGPQVLRDVDISLLLVKFDKVVDNTVIKVFTTQVSVTSGGQDLKDTLVDGEERNIEGSSSEIVDNDTSFTALLVETVCDGGGGGFVDDTKDLKTGNGTGILGGLALSVIEV